MPVLTFQSQFWDKVKSGEKRQTIRPVRKRDAIKPGDHLSLRKWSGRPYNSKQEVLREEVCKEVAVVFIFKGGLVITGTLILDDKNQNIFAREDGFDSYDDMLYWFNKTHGLPFRGVVIKW